MVNQSTTTTQNDHKNDESAVIDPKSPDINSTNQHDINSAVHTKAGNVSIFYCAIYRDVSNATRKETIILMKDTRQGEERR